MFGEHFLTLLVINVLLLGTSFLMANGVTEESVSIVFAGDISFDDTVRYHVRRGDHTYNDSFHHIARYLREADISVGNCESPFITKKMLPHRADKGKGGIRLRADADSASSLRYAGFDLMSLANDHVIDYGEFSVDFTVKSLNNAGIKTFGITYGSIHSPQEPLIMEVKGVKIGFLAYCLITTTAADCEELRSRYEAGPAPYRHKDAARDIEKLKNKVDVIVVFMHWGQELYLEPLKNEEGVAKELKTLGAHVIIGCHPHVLQRHCYHDNHVVAFSLGNFLYPFYVPGGNLYFKKEKNKMEIDFYEKSVTGCMPPTKASRLFRVRVNKKGVVKADYLPLEIDYNRDLKCLQPRPMKGAKWIDVCGPQDKECTKCQQIDGKH